MSQTDDAVPSVRQRARKPAHAWNGRPNGRPNGRSLNTRRATLQFTAAGLVTFAVVAVLAVPVVRTLAKNEAINDARMKTWTLSAAVITPNLSDGLLTGDPAAVRRMDAAVAGRVTVKTVIRVKIWTPDGRIVYSDEPRLIGERFALDDEETEALRTGESDAEVSDVSRPENRFERGRGDVLEVYEPVRTPSGRPLLFETYSSNRTVTEREQQIFAEFAPLVFGALLLLQLVQIPLARRMARRLDAGQRERERLMREALDASDATRRRIAGDLHDGVVQDLIAVSYGLTGSAARAGRDDHAEALNEAAQTVRHGIRSLRSLLVEIYPPSLHTAGLPAALADLAASMSDRGTDIDLSVPDQVTARTEAEALVFRTAQEVLRNVMAHAHAGQVDIALRERDGLLILTVADDGVGFDPGTLTDTTERGHFGLRLLRDLAIDSAGSLEIDSAPGRGTRVRLEVPAS